MYCGFADPEMLGRVTDSGVVFHDVQGKVTGPLFNILPHAYHSHLLYLVQCMRRGGGYMTG